MDKNINEDRYVIEVNAEQLRLLANACEVLSRVSIGQLDSAIEHLPLRSDIDNWEEYHKDRDQIRELISRYTQNGVDGYRSSIGIYNARPYAKILYDLHQVFRNVSLDNQETKNNTEYSINYSSVRTVMQVSESTALASVKKIDKLAALKEKCNGR